MGRMRIVLIDTHTKHLSVQERSLVVDARRIPLHLIDAIVNFSKASLSSRDLIKIADAGVPVVLVDGRNRAAIIHSPYARMSERKAEQYRAFYERRLPIAKWVLKQKVRSYDAQLITLGRPSESMQRIATIEEASNIETLMGIEGSFSKIYFQSLFDAAPRLWHKSKRSRRPPEDPLNALMSFGYMQMYHYLSIRIIATGYEPGIGFLHTPFRDHNALASDLLEAFRADIDAFTLRMIHDEVIDLHDFSRNKGVFLRYEGRTKLWKQWHEELQDYEQKLTALLREFQEVLHDQKSLDPSE